MRLGLDPGDATTLQTYQRARRFDVAFSITTERAGMLIPSDSVSVAKTT